MNPQNSSYPPPPNQPQPLPQPTVALPNNVDPTSKQSVVDRIGQAQSILVTVSNNPTIDQLAACIGLTLFLNKIGKHATAVFSGDVPSTLEFLKPEETIEKDTDSLRDFIISLDKSKADKLRYKVEDKIVKIYITPYRTSIDEKDFDFSQGDFNVDAIVALGVHKQEDLDRTITAHGKILHDATVISLNNKPGGAIGSLIIRDEKASSLCEMAVDIAQSLKPNSFDAQMATAFLTGIVAETQRFSNDKTSSSTMSHSAHLMAAGANQQLVATKLLAKPEPVIKKHVPELGELDIDHSDDEKKPIAHVESERPTTKLPERTATKPIIQPARPALNGRPSVSDVRYEDHSNENTGMMPQSNSGLYPQDPGRSYSTKAPTMGGTLTANTQPEVSSAPLNPMDPGSNGSGFNQTRPSVQPLTPTSPNSGLGDKTLDTIERAVAGGNTLEQVEKAVGSPHASLPGTDLDSARNAVLAAADSGPAPDQKLKEAGSLDNLSLDPSPQLPPLQSSTSPINPAGRTPQSSSVLPDRGLPPDKSASSTPATGPPPPVPPPMMPPSTPTP